MSNPSSKLAQELKTFLAAAIFGFISILIAGRYFPDYFALGAAALAALGLSQETDRLLDLNKREIWEERVSPWVANKHLAGSLVAIFAGVFAACAIFLPLFGPQKLYQHLAVLPQFHFPFLSLLSFNLGILVIGFLLALTYRTGGLLLILTWNAIHWSEALYSTISVLSGTMGVALAAFAALSLLPHLLFEALAYVLAGMSGVFLARGFTKYPVASAKFYRVSRACLVLLVIAALVLAVACWLEITVAATFVHA